MAPPLRVTQQYRLASMAAPLSSTGISYHSLLPHIPCIGLPIVNSSPSLGIAPQSLNSNSQPLCLPGDLVPVRGVCGCGEDCLMILIPFRLPQISCFTLSLKCFSSDSFSCPDVGIRPCFSSPTCRGHVQTYYHSCSPPSSFILPSFAWVYIFFSAGQILLSALRWCSAFTSVSEGVFLMYPWREMYSTSTVSSAILFFQYLSLSDVSFSIMLSKSVVEFYLRKYFSCKFNIFIKYRSICYLFLLG